MSITHGLLRVPRLDDSEKIAVDSPLAGGLILPLWPRLREVSGGNVERWEGFVFTIGEFSKITGLTVKTIRFYHEQDLLTPSCVDEATGYRYYDRSKIEMARIITQLRALDLSLEEIGEILRAAGDDADLRDVMIRQKTLIEAKIRRYREIVSSLEQFLNHEEETRRIMAHATFQIEEKIAPTIRVAGIRRKGRYADCGPSFAKIGKRFGRHIRGKPLLLLYDTEFKEDDADYETCMPVSRGEPVDGISVRELPGGRYVSLLHQGPYDQLGRSYAKILEFVREKDYEITSPTREIYHKGPGMIFRGNPKNYLTEIQMFIKEVPKEPGAEHEAV
jgi:DNA-binding transcriptional MerR regulator/predicted transcriptional regulator YdeE